MQAFMWSSVKRFFFGNFEQDFEKKFPQELKILHTDAIGKLGFRMQLHYVTD
jgi:hypothetical protein